MVRVFLKGGVWKNSEDEVLKAAVQKYGKQQWARVASLLNRKTAKQAKARWYEWLDPSIRKTEWSRSEEEKLLHLAKLMPAQWKTIAPLVGRTATQCQEHYEYLLDQAASEGGADGANEELRKQSSSLRAGQIDSHPETKPARPDPIDMDEDEMEMLQEARARLANTQGKKAKRKQREKMLAQAKRLADLQKRRELKQAGLLSKAALKKSKKRKNEIDFGVEIPFHKPAPVGFHDTSAEQTRTESIRAKRLKQVDFQKINENRYRSRDYEEAQRKKKEEKRLKILEQANEKYAKQKEEEVMPARSRGMLNLPAPTVTDAELNQMAKMQQAQAETGTTGQLGEGTSATQALVGDYSDRPLPTPMRAPAAASTAQRDLVQEASQLRKLERGQTPLLGGHGQGAGDEEDEDQDIIGDSKAAASHARLPDRSGSGRTPGSVAPPRDHFGLNRPATAMSEAMGDAASVGASTFASSKYSIRDLARQERRAAKRARQELEAALAALPAPQFEYELAAPADVDMEDGAKVETVDEMDQADVEKAEFDRLRKEAEKRQAARSSVLKRKDLPRPLNPSTVSCSTSSSPNADTAQKLIAAELQTLLQHDAYAHPVLKSEESSGGKKKKRRQDPELMDLASPEVALDFIPDVALESALATITSELSNKFESTVSGLVSNKEAPSHEAAELMIANETGVAAKEASEGFVYANNGWKKAKSDKDIMACLKLEFEALKEATEALKKKNDKQESKLAVINGGLAKRTAKVGQELLTTFADLQNTRIEESVYRMLQRHEVKGATDRIGQLKRGIERLRKSEASLQREYGDLMLRKRREVVKAAAESEK